MNHISACTLLCADEIAFICATRASKHKAVYTLCSRQYLANKTGYSIRQVSRAIKDMKLLGWITGQQRRANKEGEYQTNLFYPAGRMWQRIKEKCARLTKWKPTALARAIPRLKTIAKRYRRPRSASIATEKLYNNDLSELAGYYEKFGLKQGSAFAH